MKESWIIVNEWNDVEDGKNSPISRWDLVKRVEASGTKARRLAKQYEVELNNGITDPIMHHAKTKETVFTCCPTPWSQARGYISKIWDVIEFAPIYTPK
jgi:hypothetical protein